MDRDFAEIVLNPVRQRIVQYLLINGRGTVAEIGRVLSDVPRASLYRHVNLLLEAGCIQVAEERAVRGAVERTYALVEKPMGDPGPEDIARLMQGMIARLQLSFARYFARPDADPARDGLGLSSSVLMLTDEELRELLGRIGAVYKDYIQNGPGEGRRPRNIFWIIAPEDGEEEGKC